MEERPGYITGVRRHYEPTMGRHRRNTSRFFDRPPDGFAAHIARRRETMFLVPPSGTAAKQARHRRVSRVFICEARERLASPGDYASLRRGTADIDVILHQGFPDVEDAGGHNHPHARNRFSAMGLDGKRSE